MKDKLTYTAPEARLVRFVPREAISTQDGDLTYDDTMALFGTDESVMGKGISGTIIKPEPD